MRRTSALFALLLAGAGVFVLSSRPLAQGQDEPKKEVGLIEQVKLLHEQVKSLDKQLQEQDKKNESQSKRMQQLETKITDTDKRMAYLYENGPRAWVYFDTRNIMMPKGNVGNNPLMRNIKAVNRIGQNHYRVDFDGAFNGVQYIAIATQITGSLPVGRNTPMSIDVLCNDGGEFWLVLFGNFASNKQGQ